MGGATRARTLTTAAAAAAAAALAGCLYVTDLDGLSGDTQVAGSDGGSSGGPGDEGGGGGDGGVADGASGDASPGASPCAIGTHDLCDDFDHGVLGAAWTNVNQAPGGLLAIEDGPSVSPPRALHAMLPARGDVNTELRNRVFKIWENTPWRAAHLELDMRVAAPAWSNGDRGTVLVIFTLESDTTTAGTFLFVQADGFVASAEGQNGLYASGPAFPYGEWTHVAVDISPSLIRVKYGAETLEKTFAPQVAGPNPRIVLFVGLSSYQDPVPAMDARFDNVVVDLQ